MTEHFGNTEIANTCVHLMQQSAQSTLPYLYEIEANHRNMMLSIGYNSKELERVGRGIKQVTKNLASVLYGVHSQIDSESIFEKVVALGKSAVQNVNLVSERTRVVQVETFNNHIKKLSQHQEKLEENLRYLSEQTKEL